MHGYQLGKYMSPTYSVTAADMQIAIAGRTHAYNFPCRVAVLIEHQNMVHRTYKVRNNRYSDNPIAKFPSAIGYFIYYMIICMTLPESDLENKCVFEI